MSVSSSRYNTPWMEIGNTLFTLPNLKGSLRAKRFPKMLSIESDKLRNEYSRLDEQKLLTYEEADDWQKENKYIITGYRPASGSYVSSITSICSVHNETVNILSHLIGAVAFFFLSLYIFDNTISRTSTASMADFVVFSTFSLGIAICFFLSTANHNAAVSEFSLQLDFIGIVVLMWGCTLPSVYYGFYCDPELQKLYWSIITILSTGCIIAILDPRFQQPKFRPWRLSLFLGIGASSAIFMAHGVFKYGWETQRMRMSLDWMALSFTFNTIGAVCFALRIPERWNPGRYDIIGCGHQILHFMVVFAGIAHYYGLIRAFDHVHSTTDICRIL